MTLKLDGFPSTVIKGKKKKTRKKSVTTGKVVKQRRHLVKITKLF